MSKLTKVQEKQIKALENMPDSEIDTSDIPEVTNWDNAVASKFYRPIKKRLDKDRKLTSITLRMPVDVVDDLKRLAPLLGFSGYQALLKAYVGQGLREDIEKLDSDSVTAFITSLKNHGVSENTINEALADVTHG